MNAKTEIYKDKFRHLGKTLRYSLYVIFHPFDGFWDLIHERRGSIGAATAIFIMFQFIYEDPTFGSIILYMVYC